MQVDTGSIRSRLYINVVRVCSSDIVLFGCFYEPYASGWSGCNNKIASTGKVYWSSVVCTTYTLLVTVNSKGLIVHQHPMRDHYSPSLVPEYRVYMNDMHIVFYECCGQNCISLCGNCDWLLIFMNKESEIAFCMGCYSGTMSICIF